MKKLLAILMSLVLVFCFSTFVFATGEEVEKTIASLAKDASSNVIVFYYTKKPAELVTPDFEKTASVEGNKVTSLTDKITYSLNTKSEIKNF